MTIARAIAGLLGLFTLVNLASAIAGNGVDANLWWIDLRGLAGFAPVLLGAAAALILAWALKPDMGMPRRAATIGGVLALALGGWLNAAAVVAMFGRGAIHSSIPIPLSVLVAVLLMWLAWMMRRNPIVRPRPARHVALALLVACGAAAAFPLLQMALFGKTDYRRPADAIVVFGAAVYADGTLSDALADRVRTAVDLYHENLADYLVFSGGPGHGRVDEPTAMARYASERGVPRRAILLDPVGVNTDATIANCRALFARHGIKRAIAVSHFYHLPRIKLAAQRAALDVVTVPADERYTLTALPYYMAREVAAWWVYYLRGLA